MFYYIIRAIAWFLIKILWTFEVKGKKNIPLKGGLIITSNHVSYLDPIVLGISLKRKVYFIAKEEVFKNFFSNLFLRALNAFPVKRNKTDILAFKKSIKILKEGNILGIFPEGTRSINGELMELKTGVLKIAKKTGVPILPVGINGTHDIYPPKRKLPIFFKHKILVNYGIPQYFSEEDLKDKDGLEKAINMLSKSIKELSNLNINKFS